MPGNGLDDDGRNRLWSLELNHLVEVPKRDVGTLHTVREASIGFST